MGRKFAIDAQQLEAARQVLAKRPAPEAKTFTKREAIHRLRPELEAMRARGDSYEAMAEALCSAGIPIAAAVLRAYWNEMKASAVAAGKGGRSPRVRPPTRSAKDGAVAAADAGKASAGAGAAPAQRPRSRSADAPSAPPQSPRDDAASVVASDETPAAPSPAGPATPVRRSQFTVREDSEKL